MRTEYPLTLLCETLGCNRSTFYYTPRPGDDAELEEAISAVIERWPTYGYRRVTAQLKREGLRVNGKRVLRVMGQMGLTERPCAGKVHTTDSTHPFRRYPNLVQDLTIDHPDQVWVADITYVRVRLDELYLAIVMDVYTRRLRGWNLTRGLDASLTLGALRRALWAGVPHIHHSDQGVQYACGDYVDALPRGVRISMAEAGEAWQNGYAERVIRTIKEECIELEEYLDYADALRRIGPFLDEVYNHKRIHSSLGYLTPAEFEAAHYRRQSGAESSLTVPAPPAIIPSAGETEAGSAGEQPARDSRLGTRRSVASGSGPQGSLPRPLADFADAPMPEENSSLDNSTRFPV